MASVPKNCKLFSNFSQHHSSCCKNCTKHFGLNPLSHTCPNLHVSHWRHALGPEGSCKLYGYVLLGVSTYTIDDSKKDR